ncbi:MAG: hypothetical protein JSS56_07835 [Proteobacteria bacterium]|nr:hypothetical protein [Pseudomonadota bacterium]
MGRRRLHRGHFAFMRALVQGMDERSAWARYLHEEGEPSDLRRVRSTILWIKDTFAAAARREQRPGTARLIQLDPGRFAERAAPKLPSLEEFAVAQGLEDFSEDEQLEAYLAVHPEAARQGQGGKSASGGGAGRRTRVIERQLEALRWLEHLVVHDPQPLDSVQAWLSPTLSERLQRSGIRTLQDLANTMNRVGARWWRAVPGIGQHKAARLVEWLRAHAPLLQLSVGDYAVIPRSQLPAEVLQSLVPPATALRPLEKFVMPAHLVGNHGNNREVSGCSSTDSQTDAQAVQAWIAAKGDPDAPASTLTSTQRSYRKEGERLLLWAVLERGKALGAVDTQDLMDYLAFVQAPPAHWCGPRANPRWSPEWRPLEGPLSPVAVRQAKVIVHGLFAYLVHQRYLKTNPCRALMAEAQAQDVTGVTA